MKQEDILINYTPFGHADCLISDWRAPLSCGNFNVKTGKCGGTPK